MNVMMRAALMCVFENKNSSRDDNESICSDRARQPATGWGLEPPYHLGSPWKCHPLPPPHILLEIKFSLAHTIIQHKHIRTRVLLYVASATNSLRVAEVKMARGLECMNTKENKIDDISHMQH
jgi:hypothetical protein